MVNNKQTTQLYGGFTLLELLIVIAIIGILTVITLAGFSDSRILAKDTANNVLAGEYAKALIASELKTNSYPFYSAVSTNTYCFSGVGTCGRFNGGTGDGLGDSGITSAMSDYLPSNPTMHRVRITESDGTVVTAIGPTYRCHTRQDGACIGVNLDWYLEQNNKTCAAQGYVVSAPENDLLSGTWCRLSLGMAETTGGFDLDNDGYTSLFDCDDADSTVNPGATEIIGDSIDNDCDGNTL